MPLTPVVDATNTPTAHGHESNTPGGHSSGSATLIQPGGPNTSRYGDGAYGDGLYGGSTGGVVVTAHGHESAAFTSNGLGSGSPPAISDATATLSPL